MSKDHDKLMAEIQRLIAGQEFNSEEELQTHLKGLLGQKIPSSPLGLLSAEEQAQDLVFAAYKLPLNKAKLKIEKALQLDRTCIVAYEFLGTQEDAAEIANAITAAISAAQPLYETGKWVSGKLKKSRIVW